MDFSKKMNWNSTPLLNESGFVGSQINLRDNFRINDTQSDQQNEVINKLKILSDAINETSTENNARIKEKSQLLSSLDLQPQSLPRHLSQRLDKVSAILKRENLAQVNEMALIINMDRRKQEELKKTRVERELKKKYEELCTQYSYVQDKLNGVQEEVNILNDTIISTRQDSENEYSEMLLKATKLNEYKKTCENLEQELSSMKVSDDYQTKLLNKYNHYVQSTGELAVLNNSLSKYIDLPPNILQARAVLEQKEKRRQEVKKLIQEKMT